MLRPQSFALFCGVLAAIAAPGCGAETTTVSGIVRFNGKPVNGGSVIFYCGDKQIVRGIIETDGRYSIPNVPHGIATITVQSHTRIPSGLKMQQKLPKETMNAPTPLAVEAETAQKITPIPPRYSHPEESGLTLEINREHVEFDINLTP